MSNYSNIIKFISINHTPQTLTFFAFNSSHADERKLLEAYNATPALLIIYFSAILTIQSESWDIEFTVQNVASTPRLSNSYRA